MYQIQRKQERFQRAIGSYIFRQPERLYEAQAIKLDQLQQRMNQSLQTQLYDKEKVASQLIHRLEQQLPKARLSAAGQEVTYLTQRLEKAIQLSVEKKEQRFLSALQSLDLLSPLKIMGRGYSFTTKDEQVVKTIADIEAGDELNVHYQDGQALVKVIATEGEDHGKSNI